MSDPQTVRDRLWLWGHQAGSHTTGPAKDIWKLPGESRITPAEAAEYMGIPNCILVVYADQPRPPFAPAARPMASLSRLVWSIVGDSGSTRNDRQTDLEEVLHLSAEMPNVTGAMMDDFFAAEGRPRYPAETLADIRRRLKSAGPRPLDLWVVLYHDQLALPVGPCLEQCDVATFWTMRTRQLDRLEANFESFCALAAARRRVLGLYMWDYGSGRAMPVPTMKRQCELGLRWLRAGRIEGMIFLASCICDLGLEAVEWTRRWIADVADEPLGRA